MIDWSTLPSVDRVLNMGAVRSLVADFGRTRVTDSVRALLAEVRRDALRGKQWAPDALQEEALVRHLSARLEQSAKPRLIPVFNLTGTVLHTNLGRALLPEEALRAVAAVLAQPCNLEYDLDSGERGERDQLVEGLLVELTGAEAATVVNNNAAAVFLALNTLGLRKEVIVSRGELVEIGGAFRVPDIMARAGCRLKEVGTTNRTHRRDFADAITSRTALLLKVHTSNYAIQGFTAAVPEAELADLAREHGLPFMIDLGSGTLVDLRQWGLPAEPMPQEALAHGADIVSFSGDKLLGGPQAGIIVGRKELLRKIRKNPLKRALRVDKMTYAALEAVLNLYRDKERLARRLPTLRLLTRPLEAIQAVADRLLPPVGQAVAGTAAASLRPSRSQIGSGSLPVDLLPSVCIAMTPLKKGKGEGTTLKRLEQAFRNLPTPVIGRVADGAFCLDLRCLEDEQPFLDQLGALKL